MPRPLRTVCRISIHALREEGDSAVYGIWVLKSNFYPRPPRGGRHTSCAPCPGLSSFLSTPSARRATHESLVRVVVLLISIHALREEGDAQLKKRQTVREKFLSTPSARRATIAAPVAAPASAISIHALREEGDVCWAGMTASCAAFLSTPSARRATGVCSCPSRRLLISIHALREEGD